MEDIGSILPKVGECGRYRESPTKGGRVWRISGVSYQRWESVVDIESLLPKVGEYGRYRESPTKGGRVW